MVAQLGAALIAAALAASTARDHRPPIVIIPGAPGSELVDSKTGERVWPSAYHMWVRHGTDCLALPFDDPEGGTVVAGGLVREVRVAGLTFHVHSYDGLERRLQTLGYREGRWEHPEGGPEYFYFAYDWRQSVEVSGRRFAREMKRLYERLPDGTPPAIVLGHSLGGLVARYSLMYGDAPLGETGPIPRVTWDGRATIGTLFLVATPNEGTFLALKRLEKGIFYHAARGAFSPETLFSYPSVFDMIPERLDPLVDRAGKALPFNLDDPGAWERLGWSALDPSKKSTSPYAVRRAHLESELKRVRRLWSALDQLGATVNPVPIYVVAGFSRSVQRTALITEQHGQAKVSFDPPAIARNRFKALLFEPGDEMVPVRSPVASGSSHDPAGSLCFTKVFRSKSSHHHLLSSPELLDALSALLR